MVAKGDEFMSYVLMAVFWLVGLIIGSLGIIQVLIIITFGIPFTLKLQRFDILHVPNPIIKGYTASIAFWVAIITLSFILVRKFMPGLPFTGFCIGAAMPILLGLGKIGKNANNNQDYLSSNDRYIDKEKLSQLRQL